MKRLTFGPGPIAAYSATVAIDELRLFVRALDADEVKII